MTWTREKHRAFFERMRGETFEYGRNDCALFCARYLIEVHDCPDFAEGFRGEYTTEEEAFDLIRDEGGLLGMCRKYLDEKPLLQAKRGDIVWRQFRDGTEGLAVVDGRNVIAPWNDLKGFNYQGWDLEDFDVAFEVRGE